MDYASARCIGSSRHIPPASTHRSLVGAPHTRARLRPGSRSNSYNLLMHPRAAAGGRLQALAIGLVVLPVLLLMLVGAIEHAAAAGADGEMITQLTDGTAGHARIGEEVRRASEMRESRCVGAKARIE